MNAQVVAGKLQYQFEGFAFETLVMMWEVLVSHSDQMSHVQKVR